MITKEDRDRYVVANFPEVTEKFKEENHIVVFCPGCQVEMGLRIESYRHVQRTTRWGSAVGAPYSMPYSVGFYCPRCQLRKIWVVYEMYDEDAEKARIYRIASLPSEVWNQIKGLPDDPPSLKKAYAEAVRCMEANALIAAAVMLRRALQVITQDILGAKPGGTLASELKSLKGKPNKLGVTLSSDFHDNAYIVRKCGNQGAHPGKDADLLDFEPQDADDLHKIFLEIVAELYVAPAAARKAKENLMKRRKI